ncbi:MAG: acyl-CoA synthetase, partial [Alphaproteobacteria bacterium]
MMDQKTDTAHVPFKPVPFLPVPMAEPKATLEKRDNGELVIHCDYPLGDFGPSIVAYLHEWADQTPDNLWLAQRGADDAWVKVNYGEAMAKVNAISQSLLDRGFDATKPVMVLSGNSIEHALLAFGAMQIGVPISPIAQPYSTMGGGFKKLHHVVNLIKPKMILIQEGAPYADALNELDLTDIEIVCVDAPPAGVNTTYFASLLTAIPTDAVMEAYGTTNLET